MSNDERGRKLLAAAQEYLDEMSAALARDSWNITVRLLTGSLATGG